MRHSLLLDEGRLSVRWLVAALPCFFITEHLLRQELTEGLTPGLRVVFVAGWSISAWLATLGCVGMSLRFLSQPSAHLCRLADASYWIYLTHVPLVVGACAVCLWTYERWVRRSVVGSMLNGRRAAAPGRRTLVAARVSVPGAG